MFYTAKTLRFRHNTCATKTVLPAAMACAVKLRISVGNHTAKKKSYGAAPSAPAHQLPQAAKFKWPDG
jgi:hypothetical protein